jgi:uncharacterized membrane protein
MLALTLRKKVPELGILAGLAVGAGLAYFGDPYRGRRRRAHARDKVTHLTMIAEKAIDRSFRDLTNRAQGLLAASIDLVIPSPIPDEVLLERVRTRLGRLVSHPGALDVRVAAGHVILRGDVIASEAPHMLSAIRCMSGVREVIDNLTLHETAGTVPSLQGKREVHAPGLELLHDRWTPGTRALVGATGIGMLLGGLVNFVAKRRCLGTMMGIAGSGMLLRSISNVGPLEGLGIDKRATGITLQKTATIHAPVERVFDLLVNPEKLPKVMDHVREVTRIDDTHYHWAVIGPAGTPLSWDSEITRIIPNELLAWRSSPGAAIKNDGIVQFQPTGDGGTRVHIRMHYLPPGGVLAHSFAELLDMDAKHVLDNDLARLKSLVERGSATIHHRKMSIDDLEE